jgi:signal transduction histidine kinase/DNA-binding response OmpR family regulator
MNQLFRRLPFSAKLMIMAIIPLAFLIYFAIQINTSKAEKLGVLNTYQEGIDQSARISTLVDELQSERRYSFGFVLNEEWRTELVMQRQRTDAALQNTLNMPLLKGAASYTFLDSLSIMRSRIDQSVLDPTEAINFYSQAILRLNTQNIVSVNNISYLAPAKGELQGQKLLAEMITYLGTLRSNIYYALYSSNPEAVPLQLIKSDFDLYKSYLKEYQLKAHPQGVEQYSALANATNLKTTLSYIENLLRTGKYDTTVRADDWWQVSAKGVDDMKGLQRQLLLQSQAKVDKIYENEKQSKDSSLLFLILIIALVLGLMVYTITIITKMLNELNEASQKIATGATGVRIKRETNDVIGSLTDSILQIDENNKVLSHAAEAIGRGQFDVPVQPRGNDDILGHAVVKMKNDLQLFNQENEEKLWIHAGVETVNEHIRGDKQVKELAADALHAVATYTGSQIGLLYVGYDDHLQYMAGYALAHDSSIVKQVAYGDSLVGQVAQKQKTMQLKNIPSDYIKIKSGSGEALPKSLILIPLKHNGIVEGVLEIGSLDEYNRQTLAFLHQVAPAIAVAIQVAKSKAKQQELFEQVQAQSEELQVQHSELENANAELEAQTEKLQASEEELRVQQEELLQANQEMEERSRLLEERNQMIVEKNLEIQQQAEDLRLSTKYKSEFLANMSHELRTPLNSVLLLSRLLSENNEKNLSPDQVEYAQVIQSSGQGLLSLIDEILDLSKIEAGKMELEYRPVLIQEIVQDMRALFTPLAKDKKIEFLLEVDDDLPSRLETDKLRLEQILKNLLSNALKFTSQGSVQLKVTATKDQTDFINFAVKDTGIGIPSEKQALIFEAFQQADGSTRRKYGGTGLGLSISRELAKLLGGEIKVSSTPGTGSEFTLSIPLAKSQPVIKPVTVETPVVENNRQSAPVTTEIKKIFRAEHIPENIPDDRAIVLEGDKTILIIEDDTAFAKALVEFTHQKGYKALTAVRGDEGILLAQQYKPEGVLLDIQLPVKDGWEVMEELKSNPLTRHIPVHIMSSLEAKKESLMKGAVDFINKPIAFEQMQEVFKKIEHVINKENKKVLIVEENAKHAKALAYFLENFNVGTEVSNSVNKGIDALKKESVDCVILDMGIPDQQAYETLEMLKRDKGMENLPIIIFTGKSLSKTEEARIKQYADSIVIKTAHSYQRILDEVSLFLHLVESSNQSDSQTVKYKKLGALNEVLANKKILITDDDVRNIFSLTKALELHKMQVITAVDGKEAIKQLEEHPDTSVVLMDIMMPEMDGYEAMRKIRHQRQFRDLPIIAVTAKAMTGDREKCIQAGASDYISKPVDIDQLLSLLRVWLYDKSI